MPNNSIRMDLALYEGIKGTLKLTDSGLFFTSRKKNSFSLDLDKIEKVSFLLTALTTSTLYINEKEIIVCRAHLWAADIRKLRPGIPA
ncbi:MAG: hypothetical protein M1431_00235 [Candidatus Thermoplasmatota archaeon]|nr:hypothetical protein [Candidatus Thermoplasmatota archaeon]